MKQIHKIIEASELPCKKQCIRHLSDDRKSIIPVLGVSELLFPFTQHRGERENNTKKLKFMMLRTTKWSLHFNIGTLSCIFRGYFSSTSKNPICAILIASNLEELEHRITGSEYDVLEYLVQYGQLLRIKGNISISKKVPVITAFIYIRTFCKSPTRSRKPWRTLTDNANIPRGKHGPSKRDMEKEGSVITELQ